ncbi:YARHG domain-containing protein [Labilibaculum sp. A4]|uniref:YARHG domain-containing protein n=1 Tax=Labilibaculum euxinus TaxID=2686357 RepID=UPI001365A45F|nr:YARHG domain-containing protein [Labilibaculum euxinus]MDQ1772777.1 YARHG domain-containing protein [Labilibaculum euxinus]MWN78266.1 YARHG domain-containing protein [Labilibaculum euxinus]
MSFDYFVSKTDEYGELSKYMVDSFIGADWYDERDAYRAFYGDNEFKHFLINENTVLTFNMSTGGACSNIILTTFDKKGKWISSMDVAQHCDADMSSASYSYNDYEIFADTLIETYKHTTQAVDYKYSLPDSVDGLDGVETKEKINYEHYILKTNGTFEKVRTTKEIFSRQDLLKLDKKTLRLLRNEFFARYGYIFKDKELTDYFSQMDWYNPRFKDVSDKLTAFEIYNINLIKEIEDSK